MEFLRIESWQANDLLTHGFGTRDPSGKKVFREDWRKQSLDIGKERYPLVSLLQVHGDQVVVFDGNRQPEDLWRRAGDALITDVQGVALGVFTADCLPILLFDPVQQVIGIIHTGWRGTAKRILEKTLLKMQDVFHSRAQNIQAALGPCIRACCYEVDHPVRETFAENGLPWESLATSLQNGKWSLDLQRANHHLLERAGVNPEKIFTLAVCTRCDPGQFFSYRREKENKGRQMSFIALQKQISCFPKEGLSKKS
jgi:polyphenol oxidase